MLPPTLRVRRIAVLTAALTAALAFALPAAAQMYKWVDERGATTYSNTPPTTGKLPKKIEAVAERVSVYTPDSTLTRAMEDERRNDGKVKYVERQVNASRQSNAADARGRQIAYERCIAERRVDCEAIRAGADIHGYDAIPYYAPVYVFGAARRPPLVQPGAAFVEPRIGLDNRPPVGLESRPPVGLESRPPVGIDNRPPVGLPSSPQGGAPARGRSILPSR